MYCSRHTDVSQLAWKIYQITKIYICISYTSWWPTSNTDFISRPHLCWKHLQPLASWLWFLALQIFPQRSNLEFLKDCVVKRHSPHNGKQMFCSAGLLTNEFCYITTLTMSKSAPIQRHINQTRTQYFPEILPQENVTSLFYLSFDQQRLFTYCLIFAGEDQKGKEIFWRKKINVDRNKEASLNVSTISSKGVIYIYIYVNINSSKYQSSGNQCPHEWMLTYKLMSKATEV